MIEDENGVQSVRYSAEINPNSLEDDQLAAPDMSVKNFKIG